MILTIIICWLLLGICGYFMMRQGFLAQFERAFGKKDAWGRQEWIASLICILLGPMLIFWAFVICGKYCFRKR